MLILKTNLHIAKATSNYTFFRWIKMIIIYSPQEQKIDFLIKLRLWF